MIAVDTSVVVAAFASWHEGHAASAAVLARRPLLPAHAALETFSVLTRLPPPHRAAAELVAAFLESRFSKPVLTLAPGDLRHLIARASTIGLVGGQIYDAVIGMTAAQAGAKLLSRDRRAALTYERLDVPFELVT
ncbi:MAG TPA: PIN domain-containing protein [Thermoanaerobaculia bacterium]|jgi:predicted nucleic acid-binding protein|nr:PIN domain-containing protein [Thermoanaerobaculia bacterium]